MTKRSQSSPNIVKPSNAVEDRKKKTAEEEEKKGAKKTPQPPTVRVPHDSVNEMVMIAAVINDAAARKAYLTTTPPDYFYGAGHSHIWATLQAMERSCLLFSLDTLKQLGGDIDLHYVNNLIEQRPEVRNVAHHYEMLKWDHARITTARGPVTAFLESLKNTNSDPLTVQSLSKQITLGLATGTNHSLRNPLQLVHEQSREVSARRSGSAVYPFGIDGLDTYGPKDNVVIDGRHVNLAGTPRLIPGTAPGFVTVVTGVSGSGKTTATTRAVLGMYKLGRRITYGAYEQGSGMSLELLASMDIGMSRTDLMTGNFDQQDEDDLKSKMFEISERVIFDEMPTGSFQNKKGKHDNARAIDRIAQSIIDSKCDVFVADLFRRTMREMDPSDEELALYSIQALAKELKVHIILVQQQNAKQVEASKTKLPTRDTIKGSGAYVEVADQIIAWYRPALYKNIPDDRIYGMVLKQRYGKWPMMIEFDWEPVLGSIENGRTVEMKFAEEQDESSDPLSSAKWAGSNGRKGSR